MALTISMLASTAAVAAPRAQLMERAREVKREIDVLDERTEILAEDYNAAKERQAGLVKDKRKATAELRRTKKRTAKVQARLSARAEGMYRAGPSSFLGVLLGAETFEDFASSWDFLKDMNQTDAGLVKELKEAKAQQAQAERRLSRKVRDAAKVSRILAAKKRSIESKLTQRRRALNGLEAEVAALDRAEERRRVAAAREAAARAAALVSRRPSGRTFPPPTRAPRSEVVSIAKRYLGAPYQWGATGPSSFDCSGFTQFVYRQVGISLPRVSRDQIRAGERVSRRDLQPGDLVFFGSPIHHVGIYVGGGMMIHSPRTGDVVKISPLHSDYVGACRP